MNGYLATWVEWERREAEVHARFPDCTTRRGCTADAHPVDCTQWRIDMGYRPEFFFNKHGSCEGCGRGFDTWAELERHRKGCEA